MTVMDIINVSPGIFASVLQDMEDCFMQDIDILKYSISQIMFDHDIDGVDNRIASLAILINIFVRAVEYWLSFTGKMPMRYLEYTRIKWIIFYCL